MPKQPRKRSKLPKAQLKGSGDYTIENNIQDPIRRIEAKVDHLEKSVNRKPSAKTAASTVGRTLGNFVNQGDLGALAGETLAKLFGHGDYSVKSNSLIPHPGQSLPKFASNKRGTRITEREYIGDISSGSLTSGASIFSNQTFRIIPTNASTFPWLSTIASLYDQWEPHGIVFEFVSTSSEYNGVSQSLGAVIMATDYDMNDPLYTSKQQMENSDYACSTKPAVSLMHGIECDERERPTPLLYTSTGSSDPRFSTMGNFQIASQGMSAANVVLGELWVSYDITFYKKQQLPLIKLNPYLCITSTCAAGTGLLSNPTIRSTNSMLTLTQTPSKSQIRLDPTSISGRYLFTSSISNWQGEDLAPVGYNMALFAVGGGYSCPSPGTTGALRVAIYLYDVTGPNAYVEFPTRLNASAFVDASVIQVPSDYTFGY